jgi:hypothetical protein
MCEEAVATESTKNHHPPPKRAPAGVAGRAGGVDVQLCGEESNTECSSSCARDCEEAADLESSAAATIAGSTRAHGSGPRAATPPGRTGKTGPPSLPGTLPPVCHCRADHQLQRAHAGKGQCGSTRSGRQQKQGHAGQRRCCVSSPITGQAGWRCHVQGACAMTVRRAGHLSLPDK